MVAGVGAIDIALLVVAADDGWMPQTEEHLQILTYFGVRRAVVALTKADLAPDEASAVAAIRQRLKDSPFADAPIVPTSVVTGAGLAELKLALGQVLSDTPPPRDIGKPRLPVDRVFTLPGAGTVVTGTLFGGTLRRGQLVVIQPSGKSARIRRIQSHGRDVEASGPGTRTALNLADVDATDGVHRGDVVTLDGLGGPSEILDVLLDDIAEGDAVTEERRACSRPSRQRQRGGSRRARVRQGTRTRGASGRRTATGGTGLRVHRGSFHGARLGGAAYAGRRRRSRPGRHSEDISQQAARCRGWKPRPGRSRIRRAFSPHTSRTLAPSAGRSCC